MIPGGARRPLGACAALALLALLFAALAVWQVQRLHWKQALIARTTAAMQAAPLPLEQVPVGDLAQFAYRRVRVAGRYDAAGTALVAGASTLGSGYWVLTPIRTGTGLAYVNRGFVPIGTRLDAMRRMTPPGTVAVTGLLRLSEPGGGVLRRNRPGDDRWYSRDIAAIAASRHLPADPRLFADAFGETPAPAGGPVPGLTVVQFANNHLAYALTWAALALLCAGGAIVLWRKPR